MTFNKYNHNFNGNPFCSTVFPDDGYDYDYACIKNQGWTQIRGKKLSDLPKQEWDRKIPKEVIK